MVSFNKGNQIKFLKQGNIKTKNALHSQLPEILRFNPLNPRSNLHLYVLSYNSYNVSLENLVLDQLIIHKLIFFCILITYLVDIVLIL